jgi:hypothetical protein
MALPENFAVFILTHGRPNNVKTFHTLRRQGYTGPIWIIIDNEDKTADEYRKVYGDKVIVFDKLAISKTFDEGDNFGDRRAVIYARNASFKIAEALGLEYFLQLDDDYRQFKYRINHRMEYPKDHFTFKTRFDDMLSLYLDYFKAIDAKSIAMAQGGDFIAAGDEFGKPKRKCMNSFFCSVKRPFQFVGRINEDVNTYTWFQSLGNLFLTIPFVALDQDQTQSNSGGMSEMYLDSGTYVKSFYTVMYAPSCTTISMMGQKHMRLHHAIAWDNAVPKIVGEQHRKATSSKTAGK